MTIRRFFVEPEAFYNNTITIQGDEHNHLKNVLRLTEGTQIVVVCNDIYDYEAVISQIGKSKTSCKIVGKVKNEYNPSAQVTVYQALTKRDAMSNLVQQLSELGVTQFVPLITQNITKKDKASNLEKLQTVANQSTKQCKRSIALTVKPTTKFEELLQQVKDYDLVLFANELEHAQHLSKSVIKDTNKNVAIVVGSEGGFTPKEAELLEQAGAKSVSLGKRILRVQTACIAITSVVMNKLGELD